MHFFLVQVPFWKWLHVVAPELSDACGLVPLALPFGGVDEACLPFLPFLGVFGALGEGGFGW